MSADPVDPDELAGAGPQRAADPPPARPRRPRRHAEVRLRRRPPDPGARQRPRDRGPGRARRGRHAPSCEQALGVEIVSATSSRIGAAQRPGRRRCPARRRGARSTPTRCAASTPTPSAAMVAEIDQAHKDGDTLGGVVEVRRATGCRRASARHVHWDRRLDARLAARADGHPGDQGRRGRRRLRAGAAAPGSQAHDEIVPRPTAAIRRTLGPLRRHRGRHDAPARCCGSAPR